VARVVVEDPPTPALAAVVWVVVEASSFVDDREALDHSDDKYGSTPAATRKSP
jgi:hypothetical protein